LKDNNQAQINELCFKERYRQGKQGLDAITNGYKTKAAPDGRRFYKISFIELQDKN
jgi:hypothetical protein